MSDYVKPSNGWIFLSIAVGAIPMFYLNDNKGYAVGLVFSGATGLLGIFRPLWDFYRFWVVFVTLFLANAAIVFLVDWGNRHLPVVVAGPVFLIDLLLCGKFIHAFSHRS